MTTWPKDKISIKTLADLFGIINANFVSSNRATSQWVFRGQDCERYQLLPSIGRLLGQPRFPDKETLFNNEYQSLISFKVKAFKETAGYNNFVALAFAQHHGLFTRLLDWTFSPLAALFFAVENPTTHHEDGALFVFSPGTVISAMDTQIHPFSSDLPATSFLIAPATSSRIHTQSALFQHFTDPTIPFEDDRCIKISIPAAGKKNLKVDLFNAGITYHSLFYDVQGLTNDLNHVLFSNF